MSIRRMKGFTLIELLVAMAIIAALLSLAAPRYIGNIDRSKEAVLRENLATLREVLDKYYADNGVYPPNLEALVEARYMRRVPLDPVTESASTWVLVPPPQADQGAVFDVRSGAKGKTHDGTPYQNL
ncbi:type II secretion system protein [Pseudoduganella flava]|uniref:type II secretion system protein n=1 Tax=Pseudoduganella flava TaxID=871742 RepID=UPI001E52844E|nr:prepilin-type N-terminal cleavage/methylation domain-containing protein [Pseudoduganella flava]